LLHDGKVYRRRIKSALFWSMMFFHHFFFVHARNDACEILLQKTYCADKWRILTNVLRTKRFLTHLLRRVMQSRVGSMILRLHHSIMQPTNEDDMQTGDVNHQPPLHCWLVLVSIWITDSVPEHSI
jgi:hypothetical protein